MSKIRSFLSLALAIPLCLSLFACGEQNSVTPSDDTTTAGDITTENPPVIENIFSVYVSSAAEADGADGTEAHPYATLEAARDAVRALDRNGYTEIDVVVSGTFNLSESFELTAEDSGSAECPIRWKSNGAKIVGGAYIPLSDFAPVPHDLSDAEWFGDEVIDKIMSVDLKNYGITPDDVKNEDLVPCADPLVLSNIAIYSGDTMLTLARYPNDRLLSLGNIATDKEANTYTVGYTEIHNSRIEKWHAPEEVYILGYFSVYWSCDKTRVISFDTEGCTMTIVNNNGYEPKKSEGKYYWYNIPEELDVPGEYYITSDAVMYYYPLEKGGEDSVVFPLAKFDLVTSEADHVILDGFTVSDTRGKALDIEGNNFTLENCRIDRIGNHGMKMNGDNNALRNCEISHIAYTAVQMDGGDVDTLTSSGTVAENNYIHHFAESKVTYHGAFAIEGCGITVNNNELAYANHVAVRYNGNNHLFEYNDIHDVCRYTSDAGAISYSRTLKNYGNVFRYNYFHDIGSPELEVINTVGLYWDDGLGGQTAYSNVFENICGIGILAGGGPDNVIKDNLFINCITDIAYDQRYYEQAKAGVGKRKILDTVYEYVRENELFSNAFPTLIKMVYEIEPESEWFWGMPARSVVTGNKAFDNRDYVKYNVNNTPWYFTEKVLEYSTVENNETVATFTGDENAPTVAEALEKASFDIDMSKMGIQK